MARQLGSRVHLVIESCYSGGVGLSTDPVEGWLVNNFKDCFPDTIVHIILNLSHPKQEDAGFDKIAWNYAPNGVLKTIFFYFILNLVSF